jgi:signal transduction histidine kinase
MSAPRTPTGASERRAPTSLTLRGKLLLITVSVLVLGGATGAWLVIGSYGDSMREAARASNDSLAATVAEYCAAPLVFEDEEGAEEILSKLARNGEVVRATLTTETGRVLARYDKSVRAGEARERPALLADAPVSHKGERVGRLVLEASTTAVERRIAIVARRIVLGSLALILVCALLALRLQHIITGPLARLAAAMRRVGQRGELDERLEHRGDDEIGVLYERFNDMLDQLQERENQLLRSQKMEAVGQLAGGIAHDFNNLLAGIMGYAEVARLQDRAAARGESLDRILEISERAGDLVKQLLAFSRKAPSTRRPTDLNEVVGRVHGILRRTLDPRIEIVERLSTDACTADADPSQIESAVLNLAVNARDAMPDGGTITLSTGTVRLDEPAVAGIEGLLPAGEYVEIAVRDTGSGIPSELLPRIFEPFFTTKEAGKGTGLGLAAVYGTVVSHHGSVRVNSELGKGSDFRVLLPRSSAAAQGDDRSSPPRGAGRLMLVDDELVVRETAGELLRSLGYAVETFERPLDAAAFFENNHGRIDAVIVDMLMPQMSGAELIRRLRQIAPDVRVLVASGHLGINEDAPSVVDVPMIHKPFTLAALATAVERLLHPSKEIPRARV